ncbi:hypothetical protein WJX73_000917 [Symbiochloris irregularis]|uniref:Uncharacterized protein n=1 Tax=Symbiochloris irregularis TaxID=706552 RepID=A0AAW1PMS3_9CHLO
MRCGGVFMCTGDRARRPAIFSWPCLSQGNADSTAAQLSAVEPDAAAWCLSLLRYGCSAPKLRQQFLPGC